MARALTDARNQLIGLVTFPSARRLNRGIPQHEKQIVSHNHGFEQSNALARYQGGGPYRKKNYPIPDSKNVKSIHRQHARGHVSFGAHSEFKPQPPCRKPLKGTSVSSSSGSRGKRGKKGVQIGLYLDPKSQCLQIHTKKGADHPVNISFLPDQPPAGKYQYTCKKDPGCRPSSPDSKRHCIGTHYAALLKEEATRIRERRWAEEQKTPNSKPKWTRC